MPHLLRAYWYFVVRGTFVLATAISLGACTQAQNIHDTPTVQAQPCINCHAQAYVSAKNPVHVGMLPETCNTCHSTRAWIPSTLGAGVDGGVASHPWFPLVNKHANVACATCHTVGYKKGDTPTACVGCHQAAYDMTMKPAHKGVFPTACANCHSDSGWVPATPTGSIDHHWFPLANKHATAACASCHTKGYQLGDTPTDCVGCHKMNYDAAMNPSHASLPTTCNTCHDDASWFPSTYIHPWPLSGKHWTTPCVSCHTGTPPRYANTPTACAGCHAADFQRAVMMFPVHSGYPMTCDGCHSTTLWTGASGGTHPEARFPIKTGSHSNVAIACADCHIAALGSPVMGQNTDCVHCHIGAHQRPAMDAAHARLNVAGYPGPNAASPNFCFSCHPKG
jgi:hypothetical protein